MSTDADTLAGHRETHAVTRIGWLRAAILGANDGIVSTASLIVGVAAAAAGPKEILIAGIAGLVAGAMSMAAGEYVSVSSQSDAERADLAKEAAELRETPERELRELVDIYVDRGLPPDLAREVAEALTARDALGAHARDELGITEIVVARPVQAAVTSALTFSAGAAPPVLAAAFAPSGWIIPVTVAVTLALLATLGALGARLGGAPVLRAAARVTFWSAAAMAATAAIGALTGAVV